MTLHLTHGIFSVLERRSLRIVDFLSSTQNTFEFEVAMKEEDERILSSTFFFVKLTGLKKSGIAKSRREFLLARWLFSFEGSVQFISFSNNWHSRNTFSIHSSWLCDGCAIDCCDSTWRNAKMDFDNFCRLSFALFNLFMPSSRQLYASYIPRMSLGNARLNSIKNGLSDVEKSGSAHSRHRCQLPHYFSFYLRALLGSKAGKLIRNLNLLMLISIY